MTEVEVRKLVAVLLGAYPATRMAPNTATVYERMLRDLDYPAANAAVERLLATSKFMPSVAEIRESVLSLTTGDQRPGGDGWGDVLDAVGRWGVYRIPGRDFQFADPVVAQCVTSLGWEEICNSENQQADRARFIELYERHAKTTRQKQLSESLPAMQRLRQLGSGVTAPRAGSSRIDRPLELVEGDADERVSDASPFVAALHGLLGGDDVH